MIVVALLAGNVVPVKLTGYVPENMTSVSPESAPWKVCPAEELTSVGVGQVIELAPQVSTFRKLALATVPAERLMTLTGSQSFA